MYDTRVEPKIDPSLKSIQVQKPTLSRTVPNCSPLCLVPRAGEAAVHAARSQSVGLHAVGPWHRDIYALRSFCFTSSHFGSQVVPLPSVEYSFMASRSRLYSTMLSSSFTLCLRWQRGAA